MHQDEKHDAEHHDEVYQGKQSRPSENNEHARGDFAVYAAPTFRKAEANTVWQASDRSLVSATAGRMVTASARNGSERRALCGT